MCCCYIYWWRRILHFPQPKPNAWNSTKPEAHVTVIGQFHFLVTQTWGRTIYQKAKLHDEGWLTPTIEPESETAGPLPSTQCETEVYILGRLTYIEIWAEAMYTTAMMAIKSGGWTGMDRRESGDEEELRNKKLKQNDSNVQTSQYGSNSGDLQS